MEDHEDAINRLKKMCNENGIYSLSALVVFLHLSPGRTQKEISRLTRQTTSTVNDWIKLFISYGLLVGWERKRFAKHEIKLTTDGEALLSAIKAILSPCA